MADTVRQDIMEALDTALKTITKANGYKSNVGNSVFEWQPFPIDDEDMPTLIYKDLEDDIEVVHNYALHQLTIEIFFSSAGETSPKITREIISDVNKCIFAQKVAATDNYFTSGLVLDIIPVSSSLDSEQADKKLIGATMMFNFFYLTPKINSFLA